jgi:ribonuclease P protein component
LSEAKADFPPESRLLSPASFRRVFEKAGKSSDNRFTVLYRTNDRGRARLGLAVSKKNAKRAVDRNRIKRVIRESFRTNQAKLDSLDIVVLSRKGTPGFSNRELFDSLLRHWNNLVGEGGVASRSN